MRRLILLFVAILLILNVPGFSQGTAINTTGNSPDASAILDVSSNAKGMLLPRMTQVERLAIPNPAEGLTVFQTDDGCFYYFRNGIWWRVCGIPDCTGFNFSVLAGITGPNPVYAGSTIALTSTVTGGSSPITFSWSGPSGFSSTAQNPVIAGAQPAMSGVYYVTINEGHGCTASSSINVGVCGTTVLAGSNSIVVVGNTLNLSATVSNGTAPYSYSWSGPNGFSSTVQNPSISNAQTNNSGSYIVTVTDAGSCVAKDTTLVSVSNCITNDSVVFSYTGGSQSWTVPAGICGNVTFKVWGSQGGSTGGNGGYAEAKKIAVSGDVYTIYVGGQTGFNGGGTGSSNKNGGGASDIRFGGSSLNDRIIVAGGGGARGGAGEGGAGGGGNTCSNGAGGAGGFYPGGVPHAGPGNPGTCTSGGTGGSSYGGWSGGGGGGGLTSGGGGSPSGGYGNAGTDGTFGAGGNRGFNSGYPTCDSGAGGGGGYYGGGGSADGQCAALGGGGGSSWASSSLSNMVFVGGAQTGDGRIVIKW